MHISKLVVCKPRVREIPQFVIKGYLLPFYFLHMLYLIIYKRQINSEYQFRFVFYSVVIPTHLGYILICALNSFGTSSMSTNEWCTHFIVFLRENNVVQWQCVLISLGAGYSDMSPMGERPITYFSLSQCNEARLLFHYSAFFENGIIRIGYRLMPKKLVDHTRVYFPLSFQCDWKVIFYSFISMTTWWHSKGVMLACCTHHM